MSDAQITYEQLFDALRREKSRDELQKLDDGFYRLSRLFLADKHGAIGSDHAGGFGGLGAQRAGIEYQNAKRIIRELYDRRERKIITLAMHRSRTDAAVVDTAALLPEERILFDTLVDLLSQTREQVFSAIGVTGTATPAFRPSSSASVATTAKGAVERNDTSYPDAPDTLDDGDDVPAAPPARATASVPNPSLPSHYEEPSSSPIGQRADASFPISDDDAANAAVLQSVFRVKFLGAVPKVMSADGRVFGPYASGAQAELPGDIARVLIKKGRAQEV